MQISIEKNILNKMPSFKIGINHYTKVTVSESPQMIKGRLQLFQEQLFFTLDEKNVTEFQGVKEWREVWKLFGGDPNRYRPSIEALLRRIKKQKYLASINSAVDINNFFSLQYEIPMGLYDNQFLEDNVTITIGTDKTSYLGLNGRSNHLENLICLSDSQGSFGSPYIDSKRTAVSETTTSIIQVFFLQPSMEVPEAIELLESAGKMFISIHGGDSSSIILHSDQPSIKLNK